jgi:hypothetical protein
MPHVTVKSSLLIYCVVAFDLLCFDGQDLRRLLLTAQNGEEPDRWYPRATRRELRGCREKRLPLAYKVGHEDVVSKTAETLRQVAGKAF